MGLMYTKRFGGKHAGKNMPVAVLFTPVSYTDKFQAAVWLLTNTVPDERRGGLVLGGLAAFDDVQ